ncbi:MAG: serine/threonine protein kinase [Phycisphaerales bacterium]|nr:serine/threonine protein kinase [Phycisphaerales bacterium]
MATEFHQRVQQILEASAQWAPDARDAAIHRACAGDSRLLQEVKSLLPHFDMVQDFEPERLLGTVVKFPGATTCAKAGIEYAQDEPTPFSIDQYKILQVLGEGGMGVVYRGVQFKRRRPVAIKVLRQGLLSEADRCRFALEVEILRKLHHPGIAQIIHANIFGTRPYFVMEYIEGRSLTKYAEAKGLSVRQRLSLIADVCEAVDYAHQRGIIHRDLKPDNILVVDDSSNSRRAGAGQIGQPKVLDFGIARVVALDSALVRDHSGQFIGTVDYASPEQLAGKIEYLQPRSDVYTLGLIAHELLTGRLPQSVGGKRRLALEEVRLDHDHRYPATIDNEFRYYLGIVLSMALRVNSGKSFRTAGAFGAAIEHLLARYPVPSTWMRLKSRFRNLIAPSAKWHSSPASRPLRAVLRKRIGMGMEANRFRSSMFEDSSDVDLIRLARDENA